MDAEMISSMGGIACGPSPEKHIAAIKKSEFIRFAKAEI
jgi:hypothetical protein